MSEVKPKYPSWNKDYRREWGKKYRARIGADIIKARRIEAYKRNNTSERLKQRYATDSEYREKVKANSRKHNKNRNSEDSKATRRAYYLRTRKKRIEYSKNWIRFNRELWLANSAERRRKNRLKNREFSRQESLNLTDSYIRNQLSKHSEHSTDHWTQVRVDEKRKEILFNRAKSITREKAAKIISLYRNDCIHMAVIAAQFSVSPSLIRMIIKNEVHKTNRNSPVRDSVISSMSRLALLVKTSKAIANE